MPQLNDGPPEEKTDCLKFLPVLKQIAWGFEPADKDLGDEAQAHLLVCSECGFAFSEEGEKSPPPEVSGMSEDMWKELMDIVNISCAPDKGLPN